MNTKFSGDLGEDFAVSVLEGEGYTVVERNAKYAGCEADVVCDCYLDENGLPVATHFVVNEKEINKIYFTPHVYLVNINIDGVEHKAIVKEVQCHPVKDNVLHVDFYEVVANRPIVVGVPIAPKGLAEGVRAGGKLMAMIRKINVKATYDLIPEKLDIDVTNLGLGKSIKVGDLSFEGLELVTPKEVIVCTVKMTRAAMGALAAANKG